MTVAEIKKTVTMPEVLQRYGIKTKKHNISCPFHKDKRPSMKIYKDGYTCFSCGRHGDVFTFVQEMEHCSFKDAFLSLGGQYEDTKNSFSAMLRLEQAKAERTRREIAEIRHKKIKRELGLLMAFYELVLAELEPLSSMWCESYQHLFYLRHVWEEKYMNKGNGVDVVGAIGRHSKSKFIGTAL